MDHRLVDYRIEGCIICLYIYDAEISEERALEGEHDGLFFTIVDSSSELFCLDFSHLQN